MNVKKSVFLSAAVFLMTSGAFAAQRSGFSTFLDRVHTMVGGTEAEAPKPRRPSVKPEVILKMDQGNISYIYRNKIVQCGGGTAAGCTNSEIFMEPLLLDFNAQGEISKIHLTLGIENLWVEVSTEYPKGSCQFDVVLKHELTHVAFARSALARYGPAMARAIVLEAEKLPVPITQESYNRLVDIANRYFTQMVQEKTRQDDLLDSQGNNSYQWEQCAAVRGPDGQVRERKFYRRRR